MRKIVTRRGKLENKIRIILSDPKPEVGPILDAVDDFEKDNIATIDKLKKKKQIDSKRINGALRQTIQAHGPITKLLIGSATKRIHGALLTNEIEKEEKKFSIKSLIIGFIIGIISTIILFI